eukprot:GHVS01058162.1.p1 GENE.GHVS01058162.1~~GHVS01058162.1.p1  ORF type:complete len:260 (-),score=46.38 GHVS01058162.1:593-1372(-)
MQPSEAHPPTASRLRNQLSMVRERFEGFDDVIAGEAKKRKDTDDVRYQVYTESLYRIQQALNMEVQRQAEASKALRESLQKMTNDMLGGLQTEVIKRIEASQLEVHSLAVRCQKLEAHLADMKGQMPSQLQADAVVLFRDIRQLKEGLDAERADTANRDTQIGKSIAEMQHSIQTKLTEEASSRDEQLGSLKGGLDKLSRAGDSKVQQFRGLVFEEMTNLKNGLTGANQAREQSDDEILQALQQYTSSLQKGLRMRLAG